MCEFDHPKLWIVNYYDSLINEIDVRCETIFSNFPKKQTELANENEIQHGASTSLQLQPCQVFE